jgi:hypothetical protein
MLVDPARLEREYYARKPDIGDPDQRVLFGTSGHRGSPLAGSFTEAHIAAITQAICDYRSGHGIDGPCYMGKDTHALSEPAQRTALEVLVANGVDTVIQRDRGVTPTPVISHAILVYNRSRIARHRADGIVVTPSHNPPEDGGFMYNPPHGGPADTEVTAWIASASAHQDDNDRVAADLKRYLTREVGPERQERYWAIFEQLRGELAYADYLGALQRYRLENPRDPHLLAVSSFLVNYPFANRLYPESLDVLEHVGAWARTVILSDGDVVFQPLKVERSGLFDVVGGRVLIYVHKERELDDVEGRHPARHYVMVDDKMRILSAVKRQWGDRVTTVFPRQGHYAHAADVARWAPADVAIERIGELLQYDPETLVRRKT